MLPALWLLLRLRPLRLLGHLLLPLAPLPRPPPLPPLLRLLPLPLVLLLLLLPLLLPWPLLVVSAV